MMVTSWHERPRPHRFVNEQYANPGGTMQYDRFEKLVLLVGGTAIAGAFAVSSSDGLPGIAELAAQAMLLFVLFAAARWGRRGGLAAAILVSAVYVVVRIPALMTGAEVEVEATLFTIVARLGAFGLVGVVGGELCTRVRYLLAGMEGGTAIDDWSRVFNQRHLAHELTKARSRFGRYGEEFSIVVVTLSPSLFAGLRPARQRTVVRAAADVLRTGVRLVDEVARLSDGRFVVLLPHTPRAGADVVASRVAAGLRKALGARDESVRVDTFSATGELAQIDGLLGSLVEEPEDQPSSVAYSASAVSTTNPASASTDSASAASTLSTSTAALPEGSTKQ